MKASSKTMGKFTRLAAFVLFACLAGALVNDAARAQNDPLLREQIKVFADLVTLGDLFENAGDASSAPVFRAPDLGAHGVVGSGRVAAAARQHGLDWRNPGGIREVAVERPGRLISLDEIRKSILEHAAGEDEAWTVSLSRRAKPFHIDPRIKSPVRVKHLDLNSRTGKFRAIISFPEGQQPVKDKVFTGRAFPSVETLVPARAIERGATIVAEDLKTASLPRSHVTANAVEDIDAVVGMAARRHLIMGRPIRMTDLEYPKLVKRNDTVTIIYNSPGLTLKSTGRALADGIRGKTVSILNVQSKRTIEAVVTGIGIVSVSTLSARPVRSARKVAGGRGGTNSFFIR